MSSSTVNPVYFQQSWSILSTLGLLNCIAGLLVVCITKLSLLAIVPITISAAGAVANGCCYYAFYTEAPLKGRLIASGFADITWLIQEAGLSFYSYQILYRFLRGRTTRLLFLSVFWTLILVICSLRVLILVSRITQLQTSSESLQTRINHFHIGYFTTIALVECFSAYFLLAIFADARKGSGVVYSKSALFRQLSRSTELRLAALALIGITRAVTYSFQTQAQSATSTASQVDRFAYTCECYYPVVMLIDILSSRFINSEYTNNNNNIEHGNGNGSSGNGRSRLATRAAGYPRSNSGGIELSAGSSTQDGAKMKGLKRQTFVLIEPQDPPMTPGS